jgi:hypothetical protein
VEIENLLHFVLEKGKLKELTREGKGFLKFEILSHKINLSLKI